MKPIAKLIEADADAENERTEAVDLGETAELLLLVLVGVQQRIGAEGE